MADSKKRFQEIVLCADHYAKKSDMFEALGALIKILLDAGYIMTIRYDEPGLGIVVIDFNYADEEFGGPYPYWLEPEEQEQILWRDDDDEYEPETEGDRYKGWIEEPKLEGFVSDSCDSDDDDHDDDLDDDHDDDHDEEEEEESDDEDEDTIEF